MHELSHVVGCVATMSKIKNVSLFNSKGGYVSYGKSGIPFISDIIISIAPLIFGFITIYFLSSALNPIDYREAVFARVLIKDILVVYLIISITITMLPSVTDIKNAIFGYILIIVLLILQNQNIAKLRYSSDIISLIFFCVALLIVVNLILMVAKFMKILR